ncbi:MAG: hypothetical protein M3Y81_01740 [Chloroflexota bacterium]|nr:hypothetical protein [Chloroflexota bacterium]
MEMQPPQPERCPLHTQSPSSQSQSLITVDEIEKLPSKPVSRRALLKLGCGALAATTFAAMSETAWMPKRVQAMPTANYYPDTQFDIGAFVHPAQTVAGVLVDFGVIYTSQAPATLTRNPTLKDQSILWNALLTIEANYAFSPSGIFTFVAYGLPYFNRLSSSIVASHMPRLSFDHSRFVLEEAVPSPTDFGVPGITKRLFKVPVQIERNDMLFIMRSDSLANITDVSNWLKGSNTLNNRSVPSPNFNGLFDFQPTRLNFVQPGLTRKTADSLSARGVAPFSTIAREINPASSMWMGFIDQQVNGSAPRGSTVIFSAANAGGSIGRLTTAVPGDYFDHGSIIHLSHIINDLQQFYNKDPNFTTSVEPFSERVQYMFNSFQPDGSPGLPAPQDPNDPFTNGGGLGAPTGNLSTQQQTAFLPNNFLGTNAMANNFDPAVLVQPVDPHKKYRVGHNLGLQRSSRAADGTPLHIRNDGPGLSSLDVPDGSSQPTLEFMIFVPTAEFFRVMRINSASLDYVKAGQNGGTASSVPAGIEAADADDAGLERFLTATRRQNFLIPPRRHRAFPLLEEP